jgi:hypothetical protein
MYVRIIIKTLNFEKKKSIIHILFFLFLHPIKKKRLFLFSPYISIYIYIKF